MRRRPTPAEQTLWGCLRAGRLHDYHFRRQQVLLGFIADFSCAAAQLVVELDGAVHRQQEAADAARDQILRAAGVTVLRFTNDQVQYHLTAVLDTIATHLAARPAVAR